MTFDKSALSAGLLGAGLAMIVTIAYFDDYRRDAAKWRRHVDYAAKCIDTKDDGSSVDHCMKRREAFAKAYDKWLERCVRFDRPIPGDCDKQFQALQ